MRLVKQAECRGNRAGGKEDDATDDDEETRDDFLLHQHVCSNDHPDKTNDVVEAIGNQFVDENVVHRVQNVGVLGDREGECTGSKHGNQQGHKTGDNESFLFEH